MADLGSDPGFQTFLRTLTNRRTAIEANRKRRIASLLARRNLDLADIGIGEERKLEGVDEDFESRGMFRSGLRLEDRADVVQDANALRARAEFDLAEDTAEAGRQAASELAGLSTLRAQEEMSARNRIADREFRIAEQARAERLAAQQRADWLAEQQRLQALYDRQAGGGGGGGGGSRPVSTVRTYSTAPPRMRTTSRPAPLSAGTASIRRRSTPTRSRTTTRRAPSRTSPVRRGTSIYF